jgi:hypothetical protein
LFQRRLAWFALLGVKKACPHLGWSNSDDTWLLVTREHEEKVYLESLKEIFILLDSQPQASICCKLEDQQ